MHRRNFFAMLFGGLLAKWLPKAAPESPRTGYVSLNFSEWAITQAENIRFDGCVARPIDPSKPHSFTVTYRTRNGYWTAPAPTDKLLPVKHRYPQFNVDGGELGHDCENMRCDLSDEQYSALLRYKQMNHLYSFNLARISERPHKVP